MTYADLQDPVARALRASLNPGTVLAAVSGGVDSMAMLHALCDLARERDHMHVVAAHFDHGLRPGSCLDRDFVQRAADRLGARFEAGQGDVINHAHRTRQSLEAAAREMRYSFLERTADQVNADVIVTAHTRDDQIETVLMRILRGAGARGHRGILPRRGRILRPLLPVSRLEIEAYCRACGIPILEDPSNYNTRFERNRIRHHVLPELRGAYPGIDDALLRIADAAHAEFLRAEALTSRRLQLFFQPESPRAWVLSLEAFAGLDDSDDRFHVLSAALDAMSARTDVTASHYEAMLGLAGAEVGTVTDLPGVRVRREHDGMVFTRRGFRSECDGSIRTLAVPGTLDIGGWHLDARRVETPGEADLSNRGKRVAHVWCDGPLVVRLPREGDRIQPFGMSGHKKLSDLFIDGKVPWRMREHTPVVESDGEILWVVGVATSERARVGEQNTGVVCLTATRSCG